MWYDRFACVVSSNNPIVENFTLQNYIDSKHIWVSKTGFGVGVGIDPNEVQKLGWVDAELTKIGQKRDIRVFTRHYHVALQLAKVQNLVATLPSKAAALYENDPNIVILDPPFDIPPIGLKMAWSALLHHDAGHIWLRRLITDVGEALSAQ